MAIEPWDIGEDIPLTATFADDDTVLFDPQTSVVFEFENPVTGDKTTFTWTAAVPGSDIVKLSVGKFRAHIRPTHRGYWHWKWTGNGTPKRVIQSDEDTAVPVRPNVF